MKSAVRPILAAEDEESDRFILNLALERAGVCHPLFTVLDGKEAVDYLSGNPPFSDRTVHPLPALLILDVKMPHMNGFDVLAWLTGRPDFLEMPTVMLSSSCHDSDIQRARRMGARDYFVKPHDVSDLVKIVQSLPDRWLTPVSSQTVAVTGFSRIP